KVACHSCTLKLSRGCGRNCRNILTRPRPKRFKDRKSTRLNSSHVKTSYAVFCLKKKKKVQSLQALLGIDHSILALILLHLYELFLVCSQSVITPSLIIDC